MDKERKFRLILESDNLPVHMSHYSRGGAFDPEAFNKDLVGDDDEYVPEPDDDDTRDLHLAPRAVNDTSDEDSTYNNAANAALRGGHLDDMFTKVVHVTNRDAWVYKEGLGVNYVEDLKIKFPVWNKDAALTDNYKICYTVTKHPALAIMDSDISVLNQSSGDIASRKCLGILVMPNNGDSVISCGFDDQSIINAKAFNSTNDGQPAPSAVFTSTSTFNISDDGTLVAYRTPDNLMIPETVEDGLAQAAEKTPGLPFEIRYFYKEGATLSETYKGGYHIFCKGQYITTVVFADGKTMNQVEGGDLPSGVEGTNESMHITKYLLSKRLYEAAENGSGDDGYAVLVKASENPDESNYNFYTGMTPQDFVSVICDLA